MTRITFGNGTTMSADSAPRLRDALKAQLGMKLVPTKAPMDILVIEHIERPSEN